MQRFLCALLIVCGWPAMGWAVPATDGSMLLHVSSHNGRYFAKANNVPIYLVGAYQWSALVDQESASDASDNADFLVNNGQNFVRWFAGGENTAGPNISPPWLQTPTEYLRSATSGAQDGANKFDLDQFDDGNLSTPSEDSSHFFERVRGRILYYRTRGIYVYIDFWQAWFWDNAFRDGWNYWLYHPYRSGNNINSVNADANADGHGWEMGITGNAMWTREQAKLAHWLDVLKDLDNVIISPCNECFDNTNAKQWQTDVIDYIRTWEAANGGYVHPVVYSSLDSLVNTALFASTAEAVSPGGSGEDTSPQITTGAKVVIQDDDHTAPCSPSTTAKWKTFMRGSGATLTLTCNGRNNPGAAEAAAILRQKQSLVFANRMDLKTVVPNSTTAGNVCSTGYCLVGASDVVLYAPTNVDLTTSLIPTGTWRVEYFNPVTGATTTAANFTITLGSSKTFTNPFAGESVVFLEIADAGTVTGPGFKRHGGSSPEKMRPFDFYSDEEELWP